MCNLNQRGPLSLLWPEPLTSSTRMNHGWFPLCGTPTVNCNEKFWINEGLYRSAAWTPHLRKMERGIPTLQKKEKNWNNEGLYRLCGLNPSPNVRKIWKVVFKRKLPPVCPLPVIFLLQCDSRTWDSLHHIKGKKKRVIRWKKKFGRAIVNERSADNVLMKALKWRLFYKIPCRKANSKHTACCVSFCLLLWPRTLIKREPPYVSTWVN